MAWVIAGPYPPAPDAAAYRTLDFVTARLRAGDEVEVISPVPSAAHRHQRLLGVVGIARLSRATRKADGLYLRLHPLVGPTPHASPGQARIELTLLARLLRSVPRSILDIGDLGGWLTLPAGGLVLDATDELIVESEDARERLIEAGADPGRLRVILTVVRPSWGGGGMRAIPTGKGSPGDLMHEPQAIHPDADRTTIHLWVRERAAAMSDREPALGLDGDPAAPVRALPGLVLPSPPRTVKGRVAQLTARLTAWQLGPLVDHVNRLQYSVVEAIDAIARAPRGRISSDQDADAASG